MFSATNPAELGSWWHPPVDIDRIDRSVAGIRATGRDGGLGSAGRKSGRIRSAGRRRSG